MLDPKDINKLCDYSYNRASHEDKKALEEKMHKNPDFKEDASILFNIFGGFKALEVEELNHKMNQWEQKHQTSHNTPNNKIIKMNNFFKYAAAAILLLAFLPLGYQYLNSGMSSEELFSDNFSHKKAINYYSSRAISDDVDELYSEEEGEEKKKPEVAEAAEDVEEAGIVAVLSRGINAYNNHQYAEATKYFNAYMTSSNTKDKSEIEFYLAVSYLAEGRIADAKPMFEKMSKVGTKSRKADAEWYLVLSLLKENNVEQAQKNLNKIIKKKKAHPHKEKALKLKQQIEKYYVQ